MSQKKAIHVKARQAIHDRDVDSLRQVLKGENPLEEDLAYGTIMQYALESRWVSGIKTVLEHISAHPSLLKRKEDISGALFELIVQDNDVGMNAFLEWGEPLGFGAQLAFWDDSDPLLVACRHRAGKCLSALLSHPGFTPEVINIAPSDGISMLEHAIYAFWADGVELLLEAGARPVTPEGDPYALFALCSLSPIDPHEEPELFRDYARLLRALLAAGCDVNAPNPRGPSCIEIAITAWNWQAVDFLIQNGAKVPEKTSKGMSLPSLIEESATANFCSGEASAKLAWLQHQALAQEVPFSKACRPRL